jgi:hypothetical protein
VVDLKLIYNCCSIVRDKELVHMINDHLIHS